MVSGISEFEPKRQALVLLGAISLFGVYKYKLFRCQAYNDLALAFAIMCFVWFITIVFRWLFYTEQRKKDMEKTPKIEVPSCVKCVVKYNKCEEGDLNVWSFIHLICYTVIGYFVPGLYLTIIYVSVVFEIIEIGMGNTSKIIVDPVTNLLGYFIGSSLSPYRYTMCQRYWVG